MKWYNYIKHNFEHLFGSIESEPEHQSILDAMVLFAGDENHKSWNGDQWVYGIPPHPEREDILSEFQEIVVSDFKELLKVPKIPLRNISNSTPVNGYVYWITLTPKDGENEGELRDFINYLKSYNPQIIGAYERGSNNKFHSHFVIQQDNPIDSSKTPYIKYTRSMGIIKNNTNCFRLKNLEVVLLKIRYLLKESKENYGYFGDYDFWNNIIKEKLSQEIINLKRYELIKNSFNT